MNCPNCNSQISDNAHFCPHCGSPIHQAEKTIQPTQEYHVPIPPTAAPKRNNALIITIIAAASVIICVLLVCIFMATDSKNDSKAETTDVVKTEQSATGNATTDYTKVETNAQANTDNPYAWLSERKATSSDLAGKSAGDLRLMRNAIFARHGYIFKDQDLQSYFSGFSWYNPVSRDVSAKLSSIEKANVEFIQRFEGKTPATATSATPSPSPSKTAGYSSSADYRSLVCGTWLSESDLRGVSKSNLRLMRNTIYAVHGKIFQSKDLQQYFGQFSWYNPRSSNVTENSFNDTEKHNLSVIQYAESY